MIKKKKVIDENEHGLTGGTQEENKTKKILEIKNSTIPTS